MQILETIAHDTVWGGSRLIPFAHEAVKRVGHLYGCIDQEHICSTISFGSFEGKTLHDWFVNNQSKYGMEKYPRFPLVLALLDAEENLSIQVHPDDVDAMKLEGFARGKNESFFVLEPPKEGKMINGCKVQTKEDLFRLISLGKWEEAVDGIELKKGDYVYVEAGTLHAASKGSLCFEIEENSELTYRFYDYDRLDLRGRKRPLQVEKALNSVKLYKKSHVTRYGNNRPIIERSYLSQLVVNAPFFDNCQDNFVLLTLLKGDSCVNGKRLLPGTTVIMEKGDRINTGSSVWMMVKLIDCF